MTQQTPKHGYGRLYVPDRRDRLHLMAPHLPARSSRRYRTWNARTLPFDQGSAPTCVGFSCRGLLEVSPVINKPLHPTAVEIYRGAQVYDGLQDTPPEGGSTLRGGLKFLKREGWIGEYVWATHIEQVVTFVLERGPVVLGINWYDTMEEPDSRGWLRLSPQAECMGGHAILAIGANKDARGIRLINSWGAEWGAQGRAWLSFDDCARLLAEDGEAGAPTEILKGA